MLIQLLIFEISYFSNEDIYNENQYLNKINQQVILFSYHVQNLNANSI
jgi:hypothetical protein